MVLENDVEEVKVESGMSIWGEPKCNQCGACCFEYVKWQYEQGLSETEQCPEFIIRDGLAVCLVHDQERPRICEDYFCGNTDFHVRFSERGDKILRSIAEMLGTAPKSYKLPSLIPKLKSTA